MTAKVSDYKDVLYSREYFDDISPQVDLIKRVAVAVVPFLSLHASLRFPVSIVTGTLRVWNTDHNDILATVVAVVALVSSIFRYRIGRIVITIQNIIREIHKIQKKENREEIAKSLVKIFNYLLYLALITRGGLELSLIAFMTRAVLNLIKSRDEFKNDRWIEGVANFLMAGVRLNQGYTKQLQLKRNWEIKEMQ